MSESNKELSNPFSTGSGGGHFEAHIQASFVVLMLSGANPPCLPNWPITKIKLQGKHAGYQTDDIIVFVEKPSSSETRKILAQIKHTISITKRDKIFGEVIQAAWNDFNNPKIFTKGKDVLALITGPLSRSDITDVRPILEWARHAENANEFFRNVRLSKYSSKNKITKLNAFIEALKKANAGQQVSEEIVFEFLKHFHILGYDLDIKAGVTLNLLHSLINVYASENVASIWTNIVDEVQSANKNAGTLTLNSFSDKLIAPFARRSLIAFPTELSTQQPVSPRSDWSNISNIRDLAVISLIGAWDENNDADREIIEMLTNEAYESWIVKARNLLQEQLSPVAQHNGKWRVTERDSFWIESSANLFDDAIDRFQECAIRVLSDRDPQFEMQPEDRITANIRGKTFLHSPELRAGLVETLALLGNKSDALIHCSQYKGESTVAQVIRGILLKADWRLWGSLNNLLPILAESAPTHFLDSLEAAIQQSPCPFETLFAQESSGIFGSNYLTGLLWALETLAWEEQSLTRVCVILGDLAVLDPGGNSGNRPQNSLVSILLPWHPQTTASIDKRKVAVQTLAKEVPQIAWTVLLSLLPNQHQTTFGTHKPVWRNTIPQNWKEGVTHSEYWEQVDFCADLALNIASSDLKKLQELSEHLDNLPYATFNKMLELLSSQEVLSKPEGELLEIWESLTRLIVHHKRFSESKWAWNKEVLAKVEKVTDKLAPVNPILRYRRVFDERSIDLFEERGDWQEQHKALNELRQQAIIEILNEYNIEGVVQFAQSVDEPARVGNALGIIASVQIDQSLLPSLLGTEDINLKQFISGYIWSRHFTAGWTWVELAGKAQWSTEELSQFLLYLPFTQETWNRVNSWLGKNEKRYWTKVNANPYQSEGSLDNAVEKLLEYGRPKKAIDCLDKTIHEKKPLNIKLAVQALLDAPSSGEPPYAMDIHHAITLIQAVQSDPDVNPDDLFSIEWSYLSILDEHHGASPKFLENQLASNPQFFCDIIRHIYRSKKKEKLRKDPTEKEIAIASNARRLLDIWKMPPGIEPDGSFSEKKFNDWIDETKKISIETGHREVTLIHIGRVLIFSPSDPSGLWIHSAVANALNDRNAEEMREGFSTSIFNSRGVHTIDPSGKPEIELAEKYHQQAEEVENAGYQRLASTMRLLADSYRRDAKRIIDEYQK